MLITRFALVAVAAGLVISVMGLQQSLPSSAQADASPVAALSAEAAEVLREIVRERLRALVDADLEDADALYAADSSEHQCRWGSAIV